MSDVSDLGRAAAISVLFVLCIVFISSVSILAAESTNNKFNITPDNLFLNWSNSQSGNITLEAEEDNVTLTLDSSSEWSTITSNYSQEGPFNEDDYGKYWSDVGIKCFHSGSASPNRDNPLQVKNSSGVITNSSGLMNDGDKKTFTLKNAVVCPPGRYFGEYVVANSTDSDENASINVQIDVPLTTRNELDSTTGIGRFMGVMESRAKTYHSYYFNTSNISNSQNVAINLTWSDSSKDLDMFVIAYVPGYTNNPYKDQSVQRGTNYEYMQHKVPPGTEYEVRVYGNLSSSQAYTGTVYISTINAKNTTTGNDTHYISLGNINVSDTKTINLKLVNEGNITYTPEETTELYHWDYWSLLSGAQNKSFIVPSFATKVEAAVLWEGSDNYTISLYGPDGSLVGNSTDNHIKANVSGGTSKEYVDTTDVEEGFWRIEVTNNTIPAGTYNISAKFWVDSSDWFTSNYTSSLINTSGNSNDTKQLHLNLTVQNETVSGYYWGLISYKDSGKGLSIPFDLTVNTPVLIGNNSFGSSTVYKTDNIGFNRIGSDSIDFSIPINNYGNLPLNFGQSRNSTNLKYNGHFINMSYSAPSSIPAYGYDGLNVTLEINKNYTDNTAGNYTGWIYLNASDSRPYRYFNLSIVFDLSDQLIINITDLFSSNSTSPDANDIVVENTSINSSGQIYFTVKYLNGTEITDVLHQNTATWLWEPNGTKRVPGSGYPNTTNVTPGGFYEAGPGKYKLNFSIAPDQTGGWYRGYIRSNYSVNGAILSGTGSGYPLLVNDTGINITPVTSTTLSVDDDEDYVEFNATVHNFGLVKATGKLMMDNCHEDKADIEADDRKSNCGSKNDDGSFDMDIDPNGTEQCWFTWRFHPENVTDNKKCYPHLYSETDASFNDLDLEITINDEDEEGEEEDESGAAGAATCDSDSDCAASYYCAEDSTCDVLDCASDEHIVDHVCIPYSYSLKVSDWEESIYVVLGDSNVTYVNVTNNGSGTVTTKLSTTLSDDDGIDVTVGPSAYSLDPDESKDFTVTIDVHENASSGNHTGTFKAWKSGDSDVFDTASFTLVVIPTAERESEIDQTFAATKSDWENLTEVFNEIEASGLVSEQNLSKVEILIGESADLVTDIESALAAEDYSDAESKVNQLNSKLDRIRRELSGLSEEKKQGTVAFWTNVYFWIIVGVVAAGIIGLVIYMFLPPAGYHVKYGFKPEREAAWKRAHKKAKKHAKKVHKKAKEAHSKIKEKVSKKGSSSSNYNYKG